MRCFRESGQARRQVGMMRRTVRQRPSVAMPGRKRGLLPGKERNLSMRRCLCAGAASDSAGKGGR